MLSEVSTENLTNDHNLDESDYSDDDEEDLSDTDNEEEWNTPQAV